MYGIAYWNRLVEGQRHQYLCASAKGRAELREIWEGQWTANLRTAGRALLRGWDATEVEDAQRKASRWAELLQWAEDIDNQRDQFGMALEGTA